MGLMTHLKVVEAIGGADAQPRDLAIASCGNAALGAAVIAKAAGRRLLVFVPEWADAFVIGRLRALGAVIEPCPRRSGDRAARPCAGCTRRWTKARSPSPARARTTG